MVLREGRNGISPWRGTTTAFGLLAGAQRGVTEATLLRVHGHCSTSRPRYSGRQPGVGVWCIPRYMLLLLARLLTIFRFLDVSS